MKKIYLSSFFITTLATATPIIPVKNNILSYIPTTQPIRLHLGCGQSHMNGYINIDFAPSEHTVQPTSGADIFGDITKLVFQNQTIDEVRSHHVFEHFNRQHALALLVLWHYALKINGTLVIETPDFNESIKMLLLNQHSYLDKQKILRHVFGSHEAFWAYHYDGWYEEKFRHILIFLGFEIEKIQKSSYLLTRNITIIAQKKINYSPQELQNIGHELLKEHMISNSPDEVIMWQVWCKEFNEHFLPYIT